MTQSINLIIKHADSGENLFESNNYGGPIPRQYEWIRLSMTTPAHKVQSVTYFYGERSYRLDSVIVEVL